MKLKLHFCFLFIVFMFLWVASVHAQSSCCQLPDSLKIINVTDSSFCVQWQAKDTSRCDTAKAFQFRYAPVGSSDWKYIKKGYDGANTYIFCDTATPCTGYKWQVRNICINNGDSTFTDWVIGTQFTTKCNICCQLPDSLKIISVSDSSFCVQWHAKDTSQCDTAKAFQIRFKRVGTSAWKYTKKRYNGVNVYSFCDTVKPCTEYKWQVRNICIHSGDSTFTDWVTGTNFTTECDTTHDSLHLQHLTAEQLHGLKVTPNPATGLAVISGTLEGKSHIIVSSMTGKKMYETHVVTRGELRLSFRVDTFKSGIYFITILNNKHLYRISFLKQ